MVGEMKHVVFGGGSVGSALAELLHAGGDQVVVITRSGRADVASGVEITAGDASNADFATEVARGASVVYQCLNPQYDRWPELFPPLQSAVLEAAAASEAKLVSLENLYLYGPTDGRPLTEDLPAAPSGPKGRVRAEMTQQLLDVHRAGKVRMTIGRASDYFGPRGLTSHMGERVFYPVLASKNAQVFGDPTLPHTYSYIPDIASGLATLGREDGADGRAWHLPNAEAIPTEDFIQMAYDYAGTSGKVSAMPNLLLNTVALFNSNVREIKEVLYEFEEPFVVDSSSFESTFDHKATTLDVAIPTTVDWFRDHPR